jgi:hypothetical protein
VGSDRAACGHYGVTAAEVARAYSILVSLGSAMADHPRSRSRLLVLLGRVGAELGVKVLFITFAKSLRSDQAEPA